MNEDFLKFIQQRISDLHQFEFSPEYRSRFNEMTALANRTMFRAYYRVLFNAYGRGTEYEWI